MVGLSRDTTVENCSRIFRRGVSTFVYDGQHVIPRFRMVGTPKEFNVGAKRVGRANIHPEFPNTPANFSGLPFLSHRHVNISEHHPHLRRIDQNAIDSRSVQRCACILGASGRP